MTVRAPKPAAFPGLDKDHWVLEASAGTGKTYTLEHLVVDLVLEAGIPLERILIVTFTDAAALELRRRIREKLQELKDQREDKGTGGGDWVLDEAARARLDAALLSFDRTVISTIHAFCQKVLQDSAFDAGRLFRQERVNENELFSEVFREQLRTALSATEADRAFLQEALTFTGSAEALETLLRDAWKARAELVPGAADLDRARTAVASFPREALQQEEDILADLGKRSGDAALKRFSALHAILTTLDRAPSLAAWKALRKLDLLAKPRDAGWSKEVWDWTGTGPLASIRAGLAALVDVLPTPEALVVHRLLPALQAAILSRKEAEGLFDFNDMIDQVHAGLDRPGLVERLRERYAAALIDEFQDTDAKQWEIFRKVFHVEGHRLYLVGDPKQAIYDFRGGDLPTYLQARESLLAAGGGRLDLIQNFRSSPSLIEAVNKVLAPEEPPFFTGANTYPAPVTPGRPAIRLHQDGTDLPPLRLFRVPVDAKIHKLRARIAAGIAAAFRHLVDAAPRFDPGTGKPARPLHAGDLMVLTHTRAEGLSMAAALRDAGLPVAFFKADGLFQTLEALELRDLLRGILDPDDPDARGRALLTRFFGLDLAQAEACLDLPGDHPVLARLERWQELLRQRRYPRLFNAILDESGIVARLLITEPGDRSLTNLHHLLEHLRAEALAAHLDGEDLLARLEAWIRHDDFPAADDADTQRAEGEAQAVRILTIHKAKGLEAPVVALFGGYGKGPERDKVHRFHNAAGVRSAFLGSVPASRKQALAEEATEEEQRLLYVAITRPKVQLVLPVFEPDPGFPIKQGAFDPDGHPKGRHGLLNRRLRALQAEEPWAGWTVPLPSAVPEPAAAAQVGTLGPLPVLPELPEPDFRALAKAGRPLQLMSFTSLTRAFGETVRGASREEEGRADEVEAVRPLRPAGGLPGGTATGSALHELLEQVKAGSTIGTDFAAWSDRHLSMAEARLRWNGLDEALAPEALRLAWLALTTPIPLPGGPALPLDAVARRLPEMAFQMPFPGHPDGLEGSLDLIFEAEGRLHVLDWKTNTLPDGDYGPEAVASAVAEHYTLQVRIYTLAALAFAGIRDAATFEARFGGIVYLFLRGLPSGGIWTARPTWAEVQAWRAALAETPLEALALARMERGMHG